MWKFKILIQFILSKIPYGERLNYILQQLNRSFSEERISTHIREHLRILCEIRQQRPLAKARVVEIGTGWIPCFPILLYLAGANICHSFDHIPHLRFRLVSAFLESLRKHVPEIANAVDVAESTVHSRLAQLYHCPDLESLFSTAHTRYHAPADASATGLEKNSIDLVISNAVLEHVPTETIWALTRESRRLLRKSGIAYHFIGLHDHYAILSDKLSNVNFLRYPQWLWSFFVLNDIGYHNRLREKQFLDIFNACSASVIWLKNKTDSRDILALQEMKIDKSFQHLTLDELAVHQTEVILAFPED